MRTGEAFRIDVRDDERPLDVFDHPYAYAADHRIDIQIPAAAVDSWDPDGAVLRDSASPVKGIGP
jgi:hypothetical protein